MKGISLKYNCYDEDAEVFVKLGNERSDDLSEFFHELHHEDIDRILYLWKLEKETVKERVQLFKKLKDEDDMIKFRKLAEEKFPELFI